MRVKNGKTKNDSTSRQKRLESAINQGMNHRLAVTMASNSPGDTPELPEGLHKFVSRMNTKTGIEQTGERSVTGGAQGVVRNELPAMTTKSKMAIEDWPVKKFKTYEKLDTID